MIETKNVTWKEKSAGVFEGEPIVTLTSDFGEGWAKSQVALAIHRESPGAKFIDLAPVNQFSITEGAFMLLKSYSQAPRHSVHIGVVDPGVGTDRNGLIIKTNDFWFVGPDNGLLYPAAESNGIEQVFQIDDQRVSRTGLATFHGRDIFGPVAGRLLSGQHPEEFSWPIDVEDIAKHKFRPTEVVHVDPYGNVKLFGTPESLGRSLIIGDQVLVNAGDFHVPFPYERSFGYVAEGEPVAYRGSHGTLELAVRLGSGARLLGVEVGQVLNITPQYKTVSEV